MPTMQTRRLLLISYHFPPSSEVAGKPTARLVRYLPKFGWEPVVLTIPLADVTVPLDESGYADVMATARVERVARWPYLNDAALAVRSLFRSAYGWARNGRSIGPSASITATSSNSKPLQRRSAVADAIASYCAFPDSRSGWVIPAIRRARRLLAREPFDAVMTVSPPHSAQLIGLALRRRGPRLPWVAQFHDPWYVEAADLVDGVTRTPDQFQRWMVQHLEAKVVRAADLVLLATDETTETFANRYSNLRTERFGTLYNGYDPIDFPARQNGAKSAVGPIRFVYTGALYWRRTPMPLFAAVAELIRRGTITTDQIRIELIGDCEVACGRSVRKLADEAGLSAVVNILPPIPYPDALDRISHADVLLLFAQGQPKQIPAKLYDYLHTDRFILAFTDGATARVIREADAGLVVESDENAVQAIETVIQACRENRLARDSGRGDRLIKYQSGPLAEKLADYLSHLTKRYSR